MSRRVKTRNSVNAITGLITPNKSTASRGFAKSLGENSVSALPPFNPIASNRKVERIGDSDSGNRTSSRIIVAIVATRNAIIGAVIRASLANVSNISSILVQGKLKLFDLLHLVRKNHD